MRHQPQPQVYCPTCNKKFEPTQTTAMPFCSSRCRHIDLGRWFNEEYGVPWEPRNDEELLDDSHHPSVD